VAKHLCHAHRCEVSVPPRLLFCREHWRSLARTIQAAVWQTYRRGQENDKRPSRAYLAVQAIAVAYVALRANTMTADEVDRFATVRLNRLRLHREWTHQEALQIMPSATCLQRALKRARASTTQADQTALFAEADRG
jgi:hypothetical protein